MDKYFIQICRKDNAFDEISGGISFTSSYSYDYEQAYRVAKALCNDNEYFKIFRVGYARHIKLININGERIESYKLSRGTQLQYNKVVDLVNQFLDTDKADELLSEIDELVDDSINNQYAKEVDYYDLCKINQ